MRDHEGLVRLHGGPMGASWGPHDGHMKSDRGFKGAFWDSHDSWGLMAAVGASWGLMKANKQIFR